MKRLYVLLIVVLICFPMGAEAKESALGWLTIPAIDVNSPIVEIPIVNRHYVMPANDAGWLEGTADICADGFVVGLAGHRPGIFGRAHELKVGDIIVTIGECGMRRWMIYNTQSVDRSEWGWLAGPGNRIDLVLVACDDDQDHDRLIIQAQLVE